MEKMQFSIVINAPREKVWKTMLDKDTYEKWTDIFMHGSTYDGEWTEGSKILFLAPDESGQMSGMVSRIKENRQYEYVSIEHLGEVKDGKEDISSKEAKEWTGALENYTFKDVDGKTELQVDLSSNVVNPEMIEMFEKIWPKALNILKELAEKT